MSRALGLGLMGIAAVAFLAMSCSDGTGGRTNPAGPSSVGGPPASGKPASGSSADAGTHGMELAAVIGRGSGNVNVTPTAEVDGFTAEITVSVVGAPPNTAFYVQRAPEIGRANGSDGVCQRAMGLSPLGPAGAELRDFPGAAVRPPRGSPHVAGRIRLRDMSFDLPTIADGTAFDVMFRLVDDLVSPANDLRTACFTVVAK